MTIDKSFCLATIQTVIYWTIFRGNGLATSTQNASLVECVRKIESPPWREEGNCGDGPPRVVCDGLDAAERSEVSADVKCQQSAPSSPPRKTLANFTTKNIPGAIKRRFAPTSQPIQDDLVMNAAGDSDGRLAFI